MTSLGNIALAIAIFSGVATVGLAATQRHRAMRLAASAVAVALVAGTVRLVWAIATLDFSFVYVASQGRARSSSAYRFAALWAGAEGSLLYFAALASLVLLWMAWRSDVGPLGIAVSAAAIAGIALTVVGFANPFERAPLPAIRGAGLTPILEHPAMLYHPTILYLGLVTTLVPFALMIDRRSGLGGPRSSLTRVRRSLLVPWTLLTVGLATGANWAYVELGWGGYWAWDPVENTVLLPWLVLTAAIHVTRSEAICRRFPRTVLALVMMPFPLVMFGTTVTRSGGLSSVHTFADAAALGWMLGSLVVLVVIAAGLRVITTPGTQTDLTPAGQQLTQHGWLLGLSCVVALALAVVVLMGVTVPLAPGSNRIVTAPFYNRAGTPLLVVAMVLMVLVPLAKRGPSGTRTDDPDDWSRFGLIGVGIGFGLVAALAVGARDWLSIVVIAVGSAVVAGHLVDRCRIPWPTIVGHVGFVVLAFGIVSSAQSTTAAVVMAPGETEQFGSEFTFSYESFLVADGPRPRSEIVTVQSQVTTDQTAQPIVLAPALVAYPDRGVVLAETALHSTPARDIQVVLRTITDDGLAAFELSERPRLMLVWWGSTLIALAGILALGAGRRSSQQLGISIVSSSAGE